MKHETEEARRGNCYTLTRWFVESNVRYSGERVYEVRTGAAVERVLSVGVFRFHVHFVNDVAGCAAHRFNRG